MTYQPKDLAKIATQSKILQGQRALVIGIANENSIAYGCARVFRQLGADLAVTYLNGFGRGSPDKHNRLKLLAIRPDNFRSSTCLSQSGRLLRSTTLLWSPSFCLATLSTLG